jgi:hypothetical protein
LPAQWYEGKQKESKSSAAVEKSASGKEEHTETAEKAETTDRKQAAVSRASRTKRLWMKVVDYRNGRERGKRWGWEGERERGKKGMSWVSRLAGR